MQLIIKLQQNRTNYAIDVNKNDTIKTLKKNIQKASGVPWFFIILSSSCKQLEDDKTISYYDLQKGQILTDMFSYRVSYGGVHVNFSSGDDLWEKCYGSNKVLDLKTMIQEKRNIPIENQTIINKGQILEDGSKMETYGFKGARFLAKLTCLNLDKSNGNADSEFGFFFIWHAQYRSDQNSRLGNLTKKCVKIDTNLILKMKFVEFLNENKSKRKRNKEDLLIESLFEIGFKIEFSLIWNGSNTETISQSLSCQIIPKKCLVKYNSNWLINDETVQLKNNDNFLKNSIYQFKIQPLEKSFQNLNWLYSFRTEY
ncbi:uv excision repair protein rad23 [Anaeramoeba flamelloides]|uniref:Uv excision repair protein rad23 n=1 Tax=Anaeramoeba flamelloides TaxID=1746091 RepID=A0ABQ8X5G9_9EUKA|nr:uv excision repair protein rad23 [Anaeramoeba flamelloides]